jgi:hypothetical protein
MAYSQYFQKASQLMAAASVTDTSLPTFGGITGLVANANGSLTATWAPATGTKPNFRYRVYISTSNAPATLFALTSVPYVSRSSSSPTSIDIWEDGTGAVLQNGVTYYVGIRAIDAQSFFDTNTASLSAVSLGVPATSTNNLLNQLIATVGTPAGASVSADIAQVEANAVSLVNGLDILFEVPDFEIPVTGTKDIPILIRFAKKGGSAAVDMDSSTVNINIVNAAAGSVVASTPMTRLNTGVYRYDLNISSSFTPQMLIVAFTFNYLTVSFTRSQVVEALSIYQGIATIEATLGTPAGPSMSADIASVKSDTSGLRTDYTTIRAGKLDNLDATVSSRATQTSVNTVQSSVNAIPTTPQLASVALTQYNTLTSAISSVQNNTNFSGVIPQIMDQQTGAGTKTYTFYANVFNTSGAPANPDSTILNYTVKDSSGTTLKAQAAMTNTGVGAFTGTFTVTSAMAETDVVVFFNYSVSAVAFQQVRTSKIESIATDSANIAAILSFTQNLPADPASNTVVNTRASQTSLNTLEATVGTPAGASVSADIAAVKSDTGGLRTDYTTARASKLDNLDAAMSSRSSQTSLNSLQASVNAVQSGVNITISQTSDSAIADAVWDEPLSPHNTAGSAGATLSGVSAQSSPTAIAAAVWSATLASFLSVGTTGRALNDAAYSGTGLTPIDYQNIADYIWDESISGHTNPNTFGERNNTLITQGNANNLANLDVAVSTRAPSATAVSSNDLTVPRIAKLDYLDVAVSSRAGVSDLAPIIAQTNLIPAFPATQAAVLNIPTNPLLVTDGRLTALDATISSRATPANLTPLATTADLAGFEAEVAIAIYNVQVSADEAARPSDITSAVAPLATGAEVAAVQDTLNTLAGEVVTPADVWSFGTRGLTEPVDTTDDLTPLAKTTDVTAARDAVIANLTQWTPKLVVAINPSTDEMTLLSWLELNGQVSMLASSSSVNVYDNTGTLVMAVGPDDMAFANGIFSFARANASTVLHANNAYTCTVDITIGVTTYAGVVPITVF